MPCSHFGGIIVGKTGVDNPVGYILNLCNLCHLPNRVTIPPEPIYNCNYTRSSAMHKYLNLTFSLDLVRSDRTIYDI